MLVLKRVLRFGLLPIFRLLFLARILKPRVVVMIDGGICSQIMQYLMGRTYAEKGMDVVYDLDFYEKWGKDVNGKFERNFDLQKLLPNLELRVVSRLERKLYSFLFRCNQLSFEVSEKERFSYLNYCPPVFLGGYYTPKKELWLDFFPKYIELNARNLDRSSKLVLSRIEKEPNSVAVHVRRGDLSEEVVGYGKPVSVSYYKNAVDYLVKQVSHAHFFFFSDEPTWVAENIIKGDLENCSTLVSSNDSSKGYMDLILISKCYHQITSKGSLGKFGALANSNENKIVVLYDDEIEKAWLEIFSTNAVFLKEIHE